jgi:hypothetical protein
MPTSQRSGSRASIMTATLMSRMVVPFLAFAVALWRGALVFAVQQVPANRRVDPQSRNHRAGGLKAGSGRTRSVWQRSQRRKLKPRPCRPGLAGSPPPPDSGPLFDIARIEPTGEAVIAGPVAPGAKA